MCARSDLWTVNDIMPNCLVHITLMDALSFPSTDIDTLFWWANQGEDSFKSMCLL